MLVIFYPKDFVEKERKYILRENKNTIFFLQSTQIEYGFSLLNFKIEMQYTLFQTNIEHNTNTIFIYRIGLVRKIRIKASVIPSLY